LQSSGEITEPSGVLEDGVWSETKKGTPQGSVISPLLCNVYLHYVFDLWVQHWRTHRATGEVIVVRYADDMVLGFQHRAEAERFLQDWRERLRKFELELHPDKTRLIEFGRLWPYGTALAHASSYCRGYRGSLCGRHGTGVSASSGGRTISPRLARAAAEVRAGITSG